MLITRKRLLTTLHLSTRNCILTEQGQIRTFWYDEKHKKTKTGWIILFDEGGIGKYRRCHTDT